MIRLICLLSLLVFANSTAAQTPTPQPKAAPVTAEPNDFSIEELLKQTSAVRGLKIKKTVAGGLRSRDQIEKMVKGDFAGADVAKWARSSEVFLQVLGLAPPGFDYRQMQIGSMKEGLAGYYDPRKKEFNLADWTSGGRRKAVAVHELTHALQDQNFDLQKTQQRAQNADMNLAIEALIEGDASFTVRVYHRQNPKERESYEAALDEIEKAEKEAQSEDAKNKDDKVFKSAPRILRESILFPYRNGYSWVEEIYRRGGWRAVNRAYQQPPQSTEHILHPLKYFVREAPHDVALADTSKFLGKGWKTLDVGTKGEFGLYLVLDEYLKDERRARDAAAGWGGDFYALYEGPKSAMPRACVVKMTSWDTPKDALEFFMAYARRTDLRYAKEKKSRIVWPQGGVTRTWKTANHNVILERRGHRVLVIEGLPTTAQKGIVSSALWQVVAQ